MLTSFITLAPVTFMLNRDSFGESRIKYDD